LPILFYFFICAIVGQLSDKCPTQVSCSMRSTRADLRLPPIIHAYLEELAKIGVYGKGKSGVMRRFIEQGVQKAIEGRVIPPKNVTDFEDGEENEDEAE
jgi:hypothetical protein